MKVLATSLVAAWAIRSGIPLGEALAIVLLLYCAAFIWCTPKTGLIALVSMCYALPAVPELSYLASQLFVATAAFFSIATVRDWWRRKRPTPPRFFFIATTGFIAWFALNFIVASHWGVSLDLWLRGAVPFLLLGLVFPILILNLRADDAIWGWVAIAVGAVSLSLSLQALWTYLHLQLWNPLTYEHPAVQAYLHSPIGREMQHFVTYKPGQQIWLRTAVFLPAVQGALVPVGVVGWFVAMMCWPRYRLLTVTACTICMCAVMVTLTRSMLVSVLLIEGLIVASIFSRHRLRRETLALLAGSMVAILAFGIFFHTADDFMVRFGTLGRDIQQFMQERTSTPTMQPSKKAMAELAEEAVKPSLVIENADLGYRMQEYQEGRRLFLEAPLFGHGLGTEVHLKVPTPDGRVVDFDPHYVHNWVLYWGIMGGITGVFLFALLLMMPLANLGAHQGTEPTRYCAAAASGMLIVYGSFFALLRSIPYTFLMALLLTYFLRVRFPRTTAVGTQ